MKTPSTEGAEDPAAAFDEIAKILFVKVWVERELKSKRRRLNLFTAEFLDQQLGSNPLDDLFGKTKAFYKADQIFEAAQTAYDAAVAQLTNTQNKIATGQTALTALLPSRQEQVRKAAEMLKNAQGQVQADPQNLAPRNFRSQASVDREAEKENQERAVRYIRQAQGIPGYVKIP